MATALAPPDRRFALDRFGRSAADDLLLIEQVALEPATVARAALRAVLEAGAERLAAPVRVAAASWLGRVGDLADLPVLLAASVSAEGELSGAARAAANRLVATALRSGLAKAAAERLVAAAAAEPALAELRVDAGAALALAGFHADAIAQFRVAAPSIGELGASLADQLATRTVAGIGLQRLAECWQPQGAVGFDLPRDPLAHEDELHALRLRGAFALALRADAPAAEPAPFLAAAFDQAPVDTRRCIANEAWFGPLGPLYGRALALRSGRSDRWLAGGHAIVAAIEASHERHGHGVLARAGTEDDPAHERPAAWCFLTVAEALLEESADPAAARAMVAPRRVVLAATSSFANQELAAEAALLQARIELYAGDGAAAHAAAEEALRIARELLAASGRDRAERIGGGEAPPPLGATLEGRDDPAWSGLVARALATRSSVRATLLGDVAGAAADLFEA
ncbi:MAG: hypothetical protein FJ293_07630, partial [Planctomycetes bacterium]|nr:hypothetical protein [Planctomycetota bacterium]